MSQLSRRKVLKGLTIALPVVWCTPIAESVITPAHATTSPDCGPFGSQEEAFAALCDGLDVQNNLKDCEECAHRFDQCGFKHPLCGF